MTKAERLRLAKLFRKAQSRVYLPEMDVWEGLATQKFLCHIFEGFNVFLKHEVKMEGIMWNIFSSPKLKSRRVDLFSDGDRWRGQTSRLIALELMSCILETGDPRDRSLWEV